MRTSHPRLLPLFRSEMQVALLSLLLLQPDREWTLDELAKQVEAPGSSVHRELRRAVDAGILLVDATGRPHRFRAATEAPAFQPLRDLLEMTAGLTGRLRRELEDVEGIVGAAIHGSWVRGRLRPDSDVDVFVVTRADRSTPMRVVGRAVRAIGREADVTVVDEGQFRAMVSSGNPFARRLLKEPRIELIGNLAELAPEDDTSRDRLRR